MKSLFQAPLTALIVSLFLGYTATLLENQLQILPGDESSNLPTLEMPNSECSLVG
ncbi:MAG: hypothetical protein HC886_03870 [Leptolyngbyaceae cyanobacterium SM1_1_3]|nr:hypothetical protein [Leptolyngbyaceae cyanobacterium SM1_1_3]NJN01550.1 hypothetical protein [Leptolyngbyaceae cyanobacterium RM1_1_2]